MTTRTYATFDPSRLAPGLSLDPSLLIVTTNPSATADNNNTVFGSEPFSVGDHFAEGYYWSTLQGDLTGLTGIGVVQPGSSLTSYVGGESTSYGLLLAEGAIYNNGAAVTSGLPTVAERTFIGMRLYVDPTSPYITWYVNGNWYYQQALPAGKFWNFAVSVGPNANGSGDLSAAINCGLTAFNNQYLLSE